jgi:O-acetyl-ADP-ribose deacetylase (regulator of RNase III)
MDELVVGARTIAIVEGDITMIPADAIVNAANGRLAGGGGVDGAIHRAGGPDIMADLTERYGPIGERRCPTGSAVLTVAGRLPARWVIHAVGPIWQGGRAGEAALLASAYRAAIGLADEAAAATVTLPAISCGIYGYPLDEASRVAVEATSSALAVCRSVGRATFVLRGTEALAAFRSALLAHGGSAGGRDTASA